MTCGFDLGCILKLFKLVLEAGIFVVQSTELCINFLHFVGKVIVFILQVIQSGGQLIDSGCELVVVELELNQSFGQLMVPIL